MYSICTCSESFTFIWFWGKKTKKLLGYYKSEGSPDNSDDHQSGYKQIVIVWFISGDHFNWWGFWILIHHENLYQPTFKNLRMRWDSEFFVFFSDGFLAFLGTERVGGRWLPRTRSLLPKRHQSQRHSKRLWKVCMLVFGASVPFRNGRQIKRCDQFQYCTQRMCSKQVGKSHWMFSVHANSTGKAWCFYIKRLSPCLWKSAELGACFRPMHSNDGYQNAAECGNLFCCD